MVELTKEEALDPSGQALMADLAGVVCSAEDLQAYLDRLVHAVKRHVVGCDEVGVTLMAGLQPTTAAYTTALTLEIDEMQYSIGDGPCLDAFRHLREDIVDMATAHKRWPTFMARVELNGILSLMALPLVSSGEALGALNLYAYTPGAFADADLPLVRMGAQRAADAIAAASEIIGARKLAQQMEHAMGSRAVIEQAKGVLIGLHRIDESAAFEVLRAESQRRNIKVRDLSTAIVRQAGQGDLRDVEETLR